MTSLSSQGRNSQQMVRASRMSDENSEHIRRNLSLAMQCELRIFEETIAEPSLRAVARHEMASIQDHLADTAKMSVRGIGLPSMETAPRTDITCLQELTKSFYYA